jgi:hypothetical protein
MNMRPLVSLIAVITVTAFGLSGCGSDSGSVKQQQQKTATITFSTVSSAHTAPLEAIQLKLSLPAGTSVADISSDLIGTNNTGTIAVPFYTTLPPAASFIVRQVGASPINFGSFARLTCNVAAGTTLDSHSFTLLANDILMTGKDANGSTVSLASQIPITLSVTFGY